MRCRYCGKTISDTALFCSHCNKPQTFSGEDSTYEDEFFDPDDSEESEDIDSPSNYPALHTLLPSTYGGVREYFYIMILSAFALLNLYGFFAVAWYGILVFAACVYLIIHEIRAIIVVRHMVLNINEHGVFGIARIKGNKKAEIDLCYSDISDVEVEKSKLFRIMDIYGNYYYFLIKHPHYWRDVIIKNKIAYFINFD